MSSKLDTKPVRRFYPSLMNMMCPYKYHLVGHAFNKKKCLGYQWYLKLKWYRSINLGHANI